MPINNVSLISFKIHHLEEELHYIITPALSMNHELQQDQLSTEQLVLGPLLVQPT